jgi:hypothetical protein
MEPIKIDIITRDEALELCKMCADKMPHLHFYIESKTQNFKNFGECIDSTREKMKDYAGTAEAFPQEFHSFNGGKSVSEFLMEDNVLRSAEKVWKEDKHTIAAHSVSCITLADENIDNLIAKENFKGFIKQ